MTKGSNQFQSRRQEIESTLTFKPAREILVLSLLSILGLIFYYRTLDKYFASDDFAVLNRVVFQNGIFIEGFFRPLSDITLYFSYIIGGFNPTYYNAVSLIIHVLNAFMFYKVCKSSPWVENQDRFHFALFAAFLFILYPYHNESVVWVVGRGSLLASFFAMACLLVVIRKTNTPQKIVFSCLFYYIGLTGYESIMPLPFLVPVLYANGENRTAYLKLFAWLMLTLLLHLLTRLMVSGVIFGSYGAEMFEPGMIVYIQRFLKVLGRSFIPPTENASLAIGLFVMVMTIIIIAEIALFRRRDQNKKAFYIFNRMLIAFLLALSVAFMFGVSTRTYEGDRLLYFPSFFLCLFLAYLIITIFKGLVWRNIIGLFIGCYFGYYLWQNNSCWRKAAEITTGIIKEFSMSGQLEEKLVVNLPEEYHGAYIFRNGLREALLLNKIDTTGIRIVNFIRTEDMTSASGQFQPTVAGDSLILPPETTIIRKKSGVYEIVTEDARYRLLDSGRTFVYYWNKVRLQRIKL